MKENNTSISWTISSASAELGVSRETVRRGLRAVGIPTGRGRTFTTRDLFRALGGDFRFERTRRERAEADRAEVRAALLKGQYIEKAALVAELGPSLTAFRELFYQKLREEVPIAMAGVDVAQARIIGTRFAEELCDRSQEIFRKWKI